MSKAFEYTTADSATIAKAIKSISLRASSVDNDIQLVGLACIKQIIDHRNVTPINDLYKALSAGQRSTAFALWAQKFGGVQINPDKKARKVLPLALSESAPDLAAAIATVWTKVKTEPTLGEAIDSGKAIQALIKRLAKAEVTDKALVQRLQAAFPELAGKSTTVKIAAVPAAATLPNQAAAIH